jgi:hypothetical protein
VQPPPDPNAPPQPVTLGTFTGLKNTVNRERLTPAELEIARNVDIDEAGQLRRRRGYTLKDPGNWHSVRDIGGKVYGVRNGVLGLIQSDFTFSVLTGVGTPPLCYTSVAGDVFYSSENASGVITDEEEITPWGHTGGQGAWLSPVLQPTETLGAISGKLLGDPPRATAIDAYSGRIYLAAENLLWATELYAYHYVDRTKGFVQFEEQITMVAAMTNGLFVGTVGGVYFLQGVFGSFKVNQVASAGVLPGSMVRVPAALVHPQIRKSPVPESQACVFMSSTGIMAGFDGGECYNLTQGYGEEWNRVVFPAAQSAAALYRQDLGDNTYVAVLDSAGDPAVNARIGDYVSAEIVRFGG